MRVVFSEKADNKLLEIYFYIAYKKFAPENAERLIAQIREKSELLSSTPRIGTVLDGDKKRFFVVQNYILVYEIKEEVILIVQVYRASEDWRKKIDEDF